VSRIRTGDHAAHGRGTADEGPDEPDCMCRNTALEQVCADAGCGFCCASVYHKAVMREGESEEVARSATIEGCPCCFGDHCEKYYKF
jgi:hypothetical protein